MKAKVGIGITTYEDISSSDFALRFYELLAETSTKLLPYKAENLVENGMVSTSTEFAYYWAKEKRLVVKAKYGVTEPYTPKSLFGGQWFTKGALSGHGEVFFGSRDPHSSHTLSVTHNFSPSVDWPVLFQQLIELTRPSQANLHVFTEREISQAGSGRFAFVRPIIGEPSFTYWKTSLGEWRGPDAWQLQERRDYRFIPQLAWSNYLGKEYFKICNFKNIKDSCANWKESNHGLIFSITESLSDVIKDPETFEGKRSNLRQAFPDNFFRS